MDSATSNDMWRYSYDRTKRVHPGTIGTVMLIVGFLAIAVVLVYLSPAGTGGDAAGSGLQGAVGTSGYRDTPSGQNSGPSMAFPPGVIRDLETITGINDGHEVVGRRVDLHVPVQQHVNDSAFWVGSPDNRLLVVLARDNRDGATRQVGEPSSHGILELLEGQTATVSGTVHAIPHAEAMFSWGLTNADRDELLDRRIYLRADAVTPHVTQ